MFFSADIIWVSEFASAGWIEPLDSFFPVEEREFFLPGPIEGCTYQNRIWAVPWFTDSGVLFYRSDLLPRPPRTWAKRPPVWSGGRKQPDLPACAMTSRRIWPPFGPKPILSSKATP